MRFSLKHHGQLSCVEHCPEGEYVLHSDYARLKAEVERLTKQNALATPRHLIASQDIKTLREQVERLTKAGDAMIHEWSSGEESDVDNFTKALWLWSLAKKGGQS
jgi:hypothetical protein